MSAFPRDTIIVYERGFSPMDGDEHVAGGGFLAWLRQNRDMIATVALMPVVVLGVAWIAEQTMRSM